MASRQGMGVVPRVATVLAMAAGLTILAGCEPQTTILVSNHTSEDLTVSSDKYPVLPTTTFKAGKSDAYIVRRGGLGECPKGLELKARDAAGTVIATLDEICVGETWSIR